MINKRNFRWGRKVCYAGKMALNHYLAKKPSSCYSHKMRWIIFARFLEESGINDVRKVDRETLSDYAENLKKRVSQGDIKISYAVNLLSTVNVVLRMMRGDSSVYISPAEHVGRRVRVRTEQPKGMDKNVVKQAAEFIIQKQGGQLHAVIIMLIRVFGLRKREACLFDARTALKQALETGKIRIFRGTKGGYGRRMYRRVKVTAEQIEILAVAADLQGGRKSFVPENTNLKQMLASVNYYWGLVRHQFDLGTIHELRAAWACERYFLLTGSLAPVLNGGKVTVSRLRDLRARKIISAEMGHRRIDIIAAYIGGRG